MADFSKRLPCPEKSLQIAAGRCPLVSNVTKLLTTTTSCEWRWTFKFEFFCSEDVLGKLSTSSQQQNLLQIDDKDEERFWRENYFHFQNFADFDSFLKRGISRASSFRPVFVVSIQLIEDKITDGWIRTAYLRCWNQPLYQLRHNHCPAAHDSCP